ncbi:MAG: serine/threonine protein kinase [Verrucomicrobiales bacterium]|nr:serine/threonine protein kinase [Verrucomicrobiales bacterium]
MTAPGAESLFAQAIELPDPVAREAFVAARCAGNAALAESVRSLLRAHEAAGGFLRTAAMNSEPLPVPEPAPPRLPGFRIERLLGAGGLGVVYAAHDEKLNRRVAVKVLKHRPDDRVRRRLLDEARKAAALEHPTIVTVYSVHDDADPPAIVMERVEGFPIDRFAAELTFEQRARLLRDVARGLAAAHARDVVHRDLKPDNVLVGPEMRPRILDFGMALTVEEARRLGGGFEGTPLYASPEQARGEALSPASDIFSFGSLMFKVLTGRPPFRGETVREVLEAIASTPPPFLRDVAVGVPEDLQAIVLACLAVRAEDRPTADVLVVELGRYLAGEPVRLKPKLYTDLLRQRVSAYSNELLGWETQGIISSEERDRLQVVQRRLLADEDHWIIDARRLTLAQTVLYTSSWIAVVAASLLVWLAREDLPPFLAWLAPLTVTATLLGLGLFAERRGETLASASFLAGAALSLVPSTLALLKELGLMTAAKPGVTALLGEAFSNPQVAFASGAAFVVSCGALIRLRMTGFAWTSAVLGTAAYVSVLTCFGWLDWVPHRQAIACLPLVGTVGIALAFERIGRVRWSFPFHGIALLALVGCLGTIAYDGPTLGLLGVRTSGYFDADRLRALSFALNGLVFLALMFAVDRAPSLDLRRTSRVLEMLALVHDEGALFANAQAHREDPWIRWDVGLHVLCAVLLLVIGAWRGRWRLLVGALGGLALGSYLLVELGLVPRAPFIFARGGAALLVAVLAFAYLLRASRGEDKSPAPRLAKTDKPGAS